MRNIPLLRFLTAVRKSSTSARPLYLVCGLDALELQIATSTAQALGFIPRVKMGNFELTTEGERWCHSQLMEFEPLFYLIATDDEGEVIHG